MTLDAEDYLEKCSLVRKKVLNFAEFRRNRAILAWIAYVRPDILAAVAKMSHITETEFGHHVEKFSRMSAKTIQKAESNLFRLRFPKLDPDSLRVRAYADASFSGNVDGSSQMGHIVFLMDDSGACAPLIYKSRKCRRVVRSAMAAESIAFADCLDDAYTVKVELERMLGRSISLEMLTDSKQLFDAVCNSTRTKERRLMLDIDAAKQAFRRKEISDLGLIRSGENLADALTKNINTDNPLLRALKSSKPPDKAVTGGPHVETWLLRRD